MADDVQFVDENDDKRTNLTEGVEMLSAGQDLLAEGSSEDHCFALNSGRVALFRGGRKVCEVTVDDANADDFFLGAAAVLLSEPELGNRPQPFTIRGVQAPVSFCSKYSGVNLRKAFTANEDLAKKVFDSLCRELGTLEEAIDPSLAGRTQTQWSTVLLGTSDPVRKITKMREAIREMAQEILKLSGRA